jgi:hypothetical protein
VLISEAVITVSLEKRPISLDSPVSCITLPVGQAAPPPPLKGLSPVAENSLPLMVPLKFTWKKSPLNVTDGSARVTAIGKFGKIRAVRFARCAFTQQLSGPVTDPKVCVTRQLGAALGVGVGVGVGVGAGELGEELPHAASESASARVRMCAFIGGSPLVGPNHSTPRRNRADSSDRMREHDQGVRIAPTPDERRGRGTAHSAINGAFMLGRGRRDNLRGQCLKRGKPAANQSA